MDKQRLAILISAIVGVLSAFLPWATVGAWGMEQSVNGLHGDGKFTLVFFGVIAGLVFVGNTAESFTKNLRVATIILGAISGLFVLINVLNFQNVLNQFGGEYFSNFGVSASLGIGIWLSLLSSVAVIVSNFVLGTKLDKADFVSAYNQTAAKVKETVQTVQEKTATDSETSTSETETAEVVTSEEMVSEVASEAEETE